MLTTLSEVEDYLAKLPIKQYDYVERLAYVKEVLRTLGSPQDKVPAIHVAGTSGKGSTAHYAADMLRRAGHSVGLTVSPHVNKVSERAQVNGAPLADEQYCRYLSEFIRLTQSHGFELSYIELLNSFSFWLFAKHELDYIVIEVGLGGRLDPTNVMTRQDKVCVITDIGLDHTEILGDTLAKIAAEKAGIIQPGATVITHQQAPEIMTPIQRKAEQAGAHLATVETVDPASSNLPDFQQRNWTLALQAVKARLKTDKQPDPDEGTLRQSLSLQIPGRFEQFGSGRATIVLDAAHNPQKIEALTKAVAKQFADQSVVYLVALGGNKQEAAKDMFQLLYGPGHRLVATTFTSATSAMRPAMDPSELAVIAKTCGWSSEDIQVEPDPYVALETAKQLAADLDQLVVVTGSFYLIDGIRKSLVS